MYFQSSYKTLLALWGSYSKKIPHTFLQLTSNTTDILRELLVKNTTHCSRVFLKQYCHFQRFPSKLNYNKNFFPEFILQNTNTLKMYLSHNIDLFRVRISNSIHTLTELLPNNSEHFLRILMNIWTDRIYQTEIP